MVVYIHTYTYMCVCVCVYIYIYTDTYVYMMEYTQCISHPYTMEYYSAIKKEWNFAICSNMDGLGAH